MSQKHGKYTQSTEYVDIDMVFNIITSYDIVYANRWALQSALNTKYRMRMLWHLAFITTPDYRIINCITIILQHTFTGPDCYQEKHQEFVIWLAAWVYKHLISLKIATRLVHSCHRHIGHVLSKITFIVLDQM